MNLLKRYGPIVLIILLIIAFLAYNNARANNDELAKCLADKEVKMYGAYWCPHCQQQKNWFGRSWKYVPYVECAMQGNPQEQTQVCKDAEITGYPTWRTSDGRERTGAIELDELAQFAGCA